jgi:hypothetical protein
MWVLSRHLNAGSLSAKARAPRHRPVTRAGRAPCSARVIGAARFDVDGRRCDVRRSDEWWHHARSAAAMVTADLQWCAEKSRISWFRFPELLQPFRGILRALASAPRQSLPQWSVMFIGSPAEILPSRHFSECCQRPIRGDAASARRLKRSVVTGGRTLGAGGAL